jgi:hypothetical protein
MAVSALSSENAWAVGWAGPQGPPGGVPPSTSGAVIAYKGKDESSWAQVDSPYPSRPPGAQVSPEEFTIDTLSSVATIAPNDVWAAGTRDYSPAFGAAGSTQTALIERWDGSAWSVAAGPHPAKGDSQLMSITTSGNGKELWAVGTWHAEASKPAQPLILHHKPAPCPAPQNPK